MNPIEQAVYNVISNHEFNINGRILRLFDNEYRLGENENTQSGRWVIQQFGDSYQVITRPDVGRFLVGFHLQEV